MLKQERQKLSQQTEAKTAKGTVKALEGLLQEAIAVKLTEDDLVRNMLQNVKIGRFTAESIRRIISKPVGSAEQARLRRDSQPVGLQGAARSVRCEEEARGSRRSPFIKSFSLHTGT